MPKGVPQVAPDRPVVGVADQGGPVARRPGAEAERGARDDGGKQEASGVGGPKPNGAPPRRFQSGRGAHMKRTAENATNRAAAVARAGKFSDDFCEVQRLRLRG